MGAGYFPGSMIIGILECTFPTFTGSPVLRGRTFRTFRYISAVVLDKNATFKLADLLKNS